MRNKQKSAGRSLRYESLIHKRHHSTKDEEKREIERREHKKVFLALVGCVAQEGAERDQAGQGRDQRAASADVHAHQQRRVILGEMGQQDCAGHVADELAGQGAEDQGVL